MAVALVANGTLASGTTSASPAFGATPTANNLLICWVCGDVNASVGGTGWSSFGGQGTVGGMAWKIAVGGDSAPTCSNTGGTVCYAQLAEFSGLATASPVDEVRANALPNTAATAVATATAADVAAGELVCMYELCVQSMAGTATSTIAINNGTAVSIGNNDATSTTINVRYGYAITTTNASADSVTTTTTSKNITSMTAAFGSFLLGAVAAGDDPPRKKRLYPQLLAQAREHRWTFLDGLWRRPLLEGVS